MTNKDKLHVFGCSLSCGTELDVERCNKVTEEQREALWPVLLSKKLNLSTCRIHARPGATVEEISDNAIHALNTEDGIFIVAWTWPQRSNYWVPDNIIDSRLDGKDRMQALVHYANVVKKTGKARPTVLQAYPLLAEHWLLHEDNLYWTLRYLKNFYMVNMTAQALGKRVININVAEETVPAVDFISDQTIPNAKYGAEHTGYLIGAGIVEIESKVVDHTYYKYWLDTDVLFREEGLHKHMNDYAKANAVDILSGIHWNRLGNRLVAEILYGQIIG
jgi:hypothetical protein